MKNIDAIANVNGINNTILIAIMRSSNFQYPGPDSSRHRLPVNWIIPLLNKIELIPYIRSRFFRKRTNVPFT